MDDPSSQDVVMSMPMRSHDGLTSIYTRVRRNNGYTGYSRTLLFPTQRNWISGSWKIFPIIMIAEFRDFVPEIKPYPPTLEGIFDLCWAMKRCRTRNQFLGTDSCNAYSPDVVAVQPNRLSNANSKFHLGVWTQRVGNNSLLLAPLVVFSNVTSETQVFRVSMFSSAKWRTLETRSCADAVTDQWEISDRLDEVHADNGAKSIQLYSCT